MLVGIFKDFSKWLFKEVAYKYSERKPGMSAGLGCCKGLFAGKLLRSVIKFPTQ